MSTTVLYLFQSNSASNALCNYHSPFSLRLWSLVWKAFAIGLCTSFNAFLSVTPLMELKPNAGSDRAWVWNTHADFADECPKPELLAIRFLNAESEWTGTELTLIVNCYVTLLV